jgi:hypothetical protein
MFIIVEGPDGVGKSTLVEALRARLAQASDVAVLKAGPPRGHPLDEYVLPLVGRRPQRVHSPDVICDRWHLGELVYPTVLDRPTQLTEPAFRYTELFLAARGAVVIHLMDEPRALAGVIRERGDDLVRPEQAELMIRMFLEAMITSTLPSLDVPARDSSPSTVDRVLRFARFAERAVVPLSEYVTYVGPRYPKYLLVGDVRGGDPKTHGYEPAFLPYANSCGEYLLRSVGAASFDRTARRWFSEFGIVNANDVDDLASVWRVTGQPRLAVLGRLAERTTLRQLGPAFDYAPHPQYWKRFRHAEHEKYGRLITGSWS